MSWKQKNLLYWVGPKIILFSEKFLLLKYIWNKNFLKIKKTNSSNRTLFFSYLGTEFLVLDLCLIDSIVDFSSCFDKTDTENKREKFLINSNGNQYLKYAEEFMIIDGYWNLWFLKTHDKWGKLNVNGHGGYMCEMKFKKNKCWDSLLLMLEDVPLRGKQMMGLQSDGCPTYRSHFVLDLLWTKWDCNRWSSLEILDLLSTSFAPIHRAHP